MAAFAEATQTHARILEIRQRMRPQMYSLQAAVCASPGLTTNSSSLDHRLELGANPRQCGERPHAVAA